MIKRKQKQGVEFDKTGAVILIALVLLAIGCGLVLNGFNKQSQELDFGGFEIQREELEQFAKLNGGYTFTLCNSQTKKCAKFIELEEWVKDNKR